MDAASAPAEVGSVLREWRERRGLSQLRLALDAGISARHLSFVETGRSKPGRETLRRILEPLDLSLREQNRLLLAAGHAPAFPERSLDDPDLAPVRHALKLILTGHEPYPAVAVDRHWNLVAANSGLLALTERTTVDPMLLEPPINVLRIGFHPRGLAPLIINFSEWRAHFRERLERQLATTRDEELGVLLEEILGYPAPEGEPNSVRESSEVLGPLRLRAPDGTELSFFGMFATFDTPFEVTSSELAIELLFPADPETEQAMRTIAPTRPTR